MPEQETNPKLRGVVLERLLDTFGQIRSSRVCSCALWILSEYCTSAHDIHAALNVTALSHMPFVSPRCSHVSPSGATLLGLTAL